MFAPECTRELYYGNCFESALEVPSEVNGATGFSAHR